MHTFNAFGSATRNIGPISKPVWNGVVRPHAVGGVLASAYRVAGAYIPAGTPVSLSEGVLTPVLVFAAKTVSDGVVTIDPAAYNITPAVGDKMVKVGEDSAVAITAVAANASDSSLLDVTVALSGVAAGDGIALIPASEDAAATPNGYLFHDIYFGDITEDVNATGAVVDFHGEGINIDLTPAASVADYMAEKVPNVVQVKFNSAAFVD